MLRHSRLDTNSNSHTGHCVICRFAEFTATLPKSIYDSATLLPAGSDPAAPGGAANIFLLVFNLGPKTAETEAAFQQLADFAVPRSEDTVACCIRTNP